MPPSYFHCQDEIDDANPPWLLLEGHEYEEIGSGVPKETSCQSQTPRSVEEQLNRPKLYQLAQLEIYMQGKVGLLTGPQELHGWYWGMGIGSTLKFFDPCSSTAYTLDIQELLDKRLHHSSITIGWLVASIMFLVMVFLQSFHQREN